MNVKKCQDRFLGPGVPGAPGVPGVPGLPPRCCVGRRGRRLFWWKYAASRGPHALIVISIDTLRADRLPMYGYAAGQTPHLTAFAREADPVRARVRPRAADAAVARVDVHGPAAVRAQGARQPRLHARTRARDDGVTVPGAADSRRPGSCRPTCSGRKPACPRDSRRTTRRCRRWRPIDRRPRSCGPDRHARGDPQVARRLAERSRLPVLPHLRAARAVHSRPRRSPAGPVRRRSGVCRRYRRPPASTRCASAVGTTPRPSSSRPITARGWATTRNRSTDCFSMTR